MRRWIVLIMAAGLVACGDSNTQVDFDGDEMGPDIHAVLSDDGTVKMGLTREFVYFALSDSARARAQADLEADSEGGFLDGIMRSVVGKALGFRAKYALDDVQDIRWEEERLRFIFTDPDRDLDDNIQLSEDRPVSESFTEEAVLEFAEAFQVVKTSGAPVQR